MVWLCPHILINHLVELIYMGIYLSQNNKKLLMSTANQFLKSSVDGLFVKGSIELKYQYGRPRSIKATPKCL